ncbi:MAG TPA: GYDIA family GHMP kinase [Ginsengibacter sp.]|nr:GYDIA family GHMP kinase [Ginsengibacter sp.]HRP44441.1 GYDIA family GHMP kinase [Ginsengibacter sp.]
MNVLKFFASGKLLLFGEYLVLRGAQSMALPLSSGQELQITTNPSGGIQWEAFEFGNQWLTIHFSNDLRILHTNDPEKARTALKFLEIISANSTITIRDLHLRFDLDFHRHYGFGTSATLTSLLSRWSGVDPYYLMQQTFGGSGYDIAAATATMPFIYSQENKIEKEFHLADAITSHLLFVYLGKKQISAGEVAAFKKKVTTKDQLHEMNRIVEAASQCTSIIEWEKLMMQSEALMSSILHFSTVKAQLFPDYPYAVKSLGAWGGDFVMATFRDISEAKKYFQQKQKQPIFTFKELAK